MFGLREVLESTLEEILARENLVHLSENELESIVADMIPSLLDDAANLALVRIKKNAPSELKKHQRDRKGFEKRLNESWKRPLDLLDLVICMSVEVGTAFTRKFLNESRGSSDAEFEALIRLHAKACQVSGEVLALLHAGFADGAHARWRSIHEMAVVACLIEKHGQDLAERYLLHEVIQQYKLACRYREAFDPLELEPLVREDIESLKAERDKLLAKFGEEFNSDYGWASLAIGSNRPSISDLEQNVELDHMRPYYRMASDNVHPNSHGTYFRLGLHSSQQDTGLLAGPSNLGLADPGHATAISLLQITASLLATESDLDCVVTMKILQALTSEVGEAFLKVDQELEALAPDDE